MDKQNKNKFKHLLCYNIVNNVNCVYKNKCMFAHNLDEQIKDSMREYIHNMIYNMSDLSNINIKENKELFDELIIFTKECKNCINGKCPGGQNCKFGVCKKEFKICHNDLLNGKCILATYLDEINDIKIHRCINGIHLTDKNLIPYYQRCSYDIDVIDYDICIFNNVNNHNKINTISITLNDNTVKTAKKLIAKNKINRTDILKLNNEKLQNSFSDDDNLFENDDLKEYINENKNIQDINEYFWRHRNIFINDNTIEFEEKTDALKLNEIKNDVNENDNVSVYEQIKNIINSIDN